MTAPKQFIVYYWPRWGDDRLEVTGAFMVRADTKSKAEARVRQHLGGWGDWTVHAYVARTFLRYRDAPENTVDLDA